jgi:molecular chaperone DnaK (HSP70)
MSGMLGKLYERSAGWFKSHRNDESTAVPSPQVTARDPEVRSRVVGIDLGTTLCAAAYISETGQTAMVRNADGEILTPSVVLFGPDKIVVGKQSRLALATQPDAVADVCQARHGK